MSAMFVGEGLIIEGSDLDNVAHIDLLIGPKDGPVGVAFANALAGQSAGHTNLLAVVSPNIPAKPATVMITKVTLKGGKQVMQMFGPAQAAVARAVVDSVIDGTLPKAKAEDWVIVCGVFIAPSANDNKKTRADERFDVDVHGTFRHTGHRDDHVIGARVDAAGIRTNRHDSTLA